MNQTSTEQKSTSLLSALDSLLAASDAFKNVRAILLMAMTFVAAGLAAAALGFLGPKGGGAIFGGLCALLAFVIHFYGANAVGILLMHEVQDQTQHDIMVAVMQSLSTGHRLI